MEKRYLMSAVDKWKWLMGICIDGKGLVQIYSQHVNLLTQPIKLGMFIPCDKNGNVLEEPICYGVGDEQYFGSRMDEYKEAQERVLFKGFDVDYFNSTIGFSVDEKYLRYWKTKQFFELGNKVVKTIKDLTHLNLELTDNALNNN